MRIRCSWGRRIQEEHIFVPSVVGVSVASFDLRKRMHADADSTAFWMIMWHDG
ncbi:MAG: hypothetical protein GY820_39640 [Gammaproteobacteria bacterium]|nr:hypothetical protein [Gammaproteobacteria bacterium]